jgi:glycine/D-amino acid oxidase-like deaminating enzyme
MAPGISTRSVHRPGTRAVTTVSADICVVGAGISGVAAALEGARLGRKVVIVDASPALGGQAIGSIIGTIIGLYTHGPKPYQITHLVADDMLRDLEADGSIYRRKSMTGTVTGWRRRSTRPASRRSSAPSSRASVSAAGASSTSSLPPDSGP